ncbi:MAG: hypothetical protein HKN76_17865 [Saprospiraceae bacterium]|nr:hypothetical protein [Saprospiraceae bacterium]
MEKRNDKDLEKIIREISEGVSQHTPPFEEVWKEAQERKLQNRKVRRFRRLAVAASVGILLVCLFLIRDHTNRNSQINEIQPLSQWRSPTEVLLSNPTSFSYGAIKSVPTDALLRLGKIDMSDDQEDS